MTRSHASTAVALTYDEIIFLTRNPAYGAFDLRQQYRQTLTRALGLGVGLFLIALSGPTLHAWVSPTDPFSDKLDTGSDKTDEVARTTR